MDLDLQQQVQKRLAELPQDVRAAIQSANVAQKVHEIGKGQNLHVDQMGKLEDEVYLVMLGFSDPAELGDTLAQEVGLTPAQAAAIATDIGNEIFRPIRASMQAWTEERAAQEDAAIVSESLATPSQAAAPISAPSLPPTPVDIPTPPSAPVVAPLPPKAPDLAAADAMLTGSKVSTAPASKKDAEKPQPYKADPYREPTI